MIELELVRLPGGTPEATLLWDEETGELTGPLADRVIQLADACSKTGEVVTHPYPTTYPIGKEPLRSRRELALILSLLWVVPEALRDALPDAPPADDFDVQPLH